jgi:hypothetical protein
MAKTFDENAFLAILARLLTERKGLTGISSEESIRWTFSHALVLAGYEHWQIQPEDDLPTYTGSRIDLRAIANGGLPVIAAEFKFHRQKDAPLPAPQLAGGIFADLARLGVAHHAWKCPCYFVYLTDSAMLDYLRQEQHGCCDFVLCPVGQSIVYDVTRLRGRSDTFLKALGRYLEPVKAICVDRRTISSQYELRVFRVEHTPSGIYDYAT